MVEGVGGWWNLTHLSARLLAGFGKNFKHDEIDLERLEFNVMDVYRRRVRFPDRCPDCHRNGLDHDMECRMDDWIGPDHGIVDTDG